MHISGCNQFNGYAARSISLQDYVTVQAIASGLWECRSMIRRTGRFGDSNAPSLCASSSSTLFQCRVMNLRISFQSQWRRKRRYSKRITRQLVPGFRIDIVLTRLVVVHSVIRSGRRPEIVAKFAIASVSVPPKGFIQSG
jgi:hypothetical protein